MLLAPCAMRANTQTILDAFLWHVHVSEDGIVWNQDAGITILDLCSRLRFFVVILDCCGDSGLRRNVLLTIDE